MTTLFRTCTLPVCLAMVAWLAGCGDASDARDALRAGHPGAMGTSADAPSATDPAADPAGMAPGSSGTPASSGSSGTPGSSGSSGTPGAPDAGADGAPPPPPPPPPADFFAGAPGYANTAGRATQNGSHPNGGTAAGAACFSCHGKNEFSMVMGGTVYADAAGTAPAANVQVVLKVGASFFSANTNANGNFVVTGSPFTGTAKVGVRSAATVHAMAGAITTGDCNSCHDGTTTSRIHLP
jgi:hypothetical protein